MSLAERGLKTVTPNAVITCEPYEQVQASVSIAMLVFSIYTQENYMKCVVESTNVKTFKRESY